MRDENYGAHGPLRKVVVEDIQIRSAVREYGAFHFGVRRIDDSVAERFGLALQLKRRSTSWAKIVDGDRISRSDVQARGFADRAEKIEHAPSFGADTGALRGRFVAVETLRGKIQVHAGIRSRLPKS